MARSVSGNASYVVADYVLTPVILAEIENFVVEMVGMMVAYKNTTGSSGLCSSSFTTLLAGSWK